ncbi:MAG: lysophospholipid acyltransferase family protein [Mycobacteriales bacterium]
MRRGYWGFWLRLAVVVLKPLLTLFTKRDWRGRDNLPRSGPAIFAVNHIGHIDPLVMSHFVYDCRRRPQFLAKASMWKVFGLRWVLNGTGQIPVYRGTAEASDALRDAVAAMERGDTVIVYPEGTTTRDPDMWPMRAKTGVARLALTTGAPVIPIAQWGAQNLYHPQKKKWRLRPRTKVWVWAGPPVDLSPWAGKPLTADALRAATTLIMTTIRDQLAEIRGERPPDDFYVRPDTDDPQKDKKPEVEK